MLNIRNIRVTEGGFDCEILHPKFGWIPFTATSEDSEDHGREIYHAIDKGIEDGTIVAIT